MPGRPGPCPSGTRCRFVLSSLPSSQRTCIGAGAVLPFRRAGRFRNHEVRVMLKSLFLQAPSFEGYDGGAGARYQAKREIRSFWYPTWLAQPAALVEGSKLIDAPPHRLKRGDIERDVRGHELIVLHT